VSDIERVAAAMHQANAELEVHPPDVTETVGQARRSLIRRLLVVGVLSAIGATLLIVGGTAPAITHIRETRNADNNNSSGKHEQGEGGGSQTGGSGGEGGPHHPKGGGGGGHPIHHPKLEAAVGPGEPISEELPDLIVSHLTKTEVTVKNLSQMSAEPFKVEVTVEAEGRDQERLIVPVKFEEGLEGESEAVATFTLKCESGVISAEVDPEKEIEESSYENNVSISSEPVKCEPAEEKEKEKEEKGKTKETTTGTGTVDSATNVAGGATEP
jgi:hypothetical protein